MVFFLFSIFLLECIFLKLLAMLLCKISPAGQKVWMPNSRPMLHYMVFPLQTGHECKIYVNTCSLLLKVSIWVKNYDCWSKFCTLIWCFFVSKHILDIMKRMEKKLCKRASNKFIWVWIDLLVYICSLQCKVKCHWHCRITVDKSIVLKSQHVILYQK